VTRPAAMFAYGGRSSSQSDPHHRR
jgi:hypothetical protein